ncbi:ABC transporter permease [Butyrivibrio sp. YAB3001]|uniref:ABC transporter permease n=1 Tax=Butyrivibrio sp. YAB3001 TaxID=1520812 RepID=UPI0008F61C07|nr:ABC transporter permease [Butyrivibrio sp. YAB3001]SFC47813.1 putative ABC transport system permease protein [Butyrivibrio sp. YAB3001]
MNIISKLTLRHLLGNKKRSIVTILGIAASTALISAIVLGVFSFFKFFGLLAIQSGGNVHAQFDEISSKQYTSLINDSRIASVGLREVEENNTGIRLINDKENRFRVGNIDHVNADFINMKVVSEYEGKLPQNSSEIAVEEQFLIDNGLENLRVGDTLTFEQGYRYIDDDLEGFIYLAGNYRSDEKFKSLGIETCTVTAILHGNRPTDGWDILRGLDDGYFPDKIKSQVIITLKKCDHTALKQLKNIVSEYGIEKRAYNTEYLLSCFAFEESGGTYKSFFVMMAVALGIVIVTSVILIFNSIGMSLTERMRYLGMLASVGATSKQKRFSIYYEGLILGLVGIPLGLFFGYIGTKITLSFLGRKILEADMLAGAEGMRGSIPIVCAPSAIAAIVFFAAITILISTFIPAIRAAKVMPIDALRQNNTVKVKARNLRVNPLIRKIFGYEGELAYKNIKRNGVKGKVITATIAVSIILFLSINYFCNSIVRANQYEFDIPYQIVASCAYNESDKLRSAITDIEGVDDVYSASMIQFLFKKAPESTVELANTDIADSKFLLPAFTELDFSVMDVVVVDDEDFNRILEDNNLNKADYYGDTLRGVLLNDFFHEKKPSEIFNDGILGQVIHYDEKQGNPPAIEIAAFVKYNANNKVLDLIPKTNIATFVPVSMYYEKAKEVLPEDRLTIDLAVETSTHEEVHDKIYSLLENNGYHSYYCADLTDAVKAMDAITLLLKTAMYGFTILLTLIAIANIVNTISTGVLLRRKEFAMYKSVGLENIGFKKMIRLETLLYGIKALVWGFPISLLLSYLMYKTFDSSLFTFNPDLLMYAIIVVAVFGILGISMALSINKIKDDNIIEALKEDAV